MKLCGADVEPWIVRQHGPIFPVHRDERVGLVGVVVDHVQDDGDAALVARVHQRLEVVLGSVGLVHGEVERRVVAPAVVAVELIDRHELQGLHAEAFQVIQGVFDECECSLFRPVPHQQFVDDQIFLVGSHKILVGPIKVRFAWCQNPHGAGRDVGRVGRHVGVRGLRNPRVVPLVQDDFGIGVGHPNVVGQDVVLVPVRLALASSVIN